MHQLTAASVPPLCSTHVALPILSYVGILRGTQGKPDEHLFLMPGANADELLRREPVQDNQNGSAVLADAPECSRYQAACENVARARADHCKSAPSVLDTTADKLLDVELWPEDSELVAEIRAMFMHNWGMDQAQADARMSRFNFKATLAALEGGAA